MLPDAKFAPPLALTFAITEPDEFCHCCKLADCPDAPTTVNGTVVEEVFVKVIFANEAVDAEIVPEELVSADDETVNGPIVPEVNVTTPAIFAELEDKVQSGVT